MFFRFLRSRNSLVSRNFFCFVFMITQTHTHTHIDENTLDTLASLIHYHCQGLLKRVRLRCKRTFQPSRSRSLAQRSAIQISNWFRTTPNVDVWSEQKKSNTRHTWSEKRSWGDDSKSTLFFLLFFSLLFMSRETEMIVRTAQRRLSMSVVYFWNTFEWAHD